MPRPKNPLPSEELRIKITPELRRRLEKLVQTGRFGNNVNQTVGQLLPDAVEAAFAKVRTSLENESAVDDLLRSSRPS